MTRSFASGSPASGCSSRSRSPSSSPRSDGWLTTAEPCARRSLLLLDRGFLGARDGPLQRPALRGLLEDGQVDLARFLVDVHDLLAAGHLRDHLGPQRLARVAAIDPLVGRDVVVVTPVADHHVALVDL